MVAINIEMPKCCIFCPLYVGKKGEGHCAITHKWNATGGLNRLDDCPLVEIGTCKDCKNLCEWHRGRSKDIYCGLHTEEDFCFEVEKDFYCTYFEKKDTCKDCRAWRPRGGENGFCARSPHRCKANESCENFERRKEE